MQVQKSAPIKQQPTSTGLAAAVDAAMADIKTIQSRMTEEIRAEDAIRGLSIQGGKVVVEYDSRMSHIPAAGLGPLVAELLKKHGVANATVTVVAGVDKQAAVEAAYADIVKIQHRLTRELRAEDGIAGLSLRGDDVVLALKAHQPFGEDVVVQVVKDHLKAHGLTGVSLDIVRPQINIRPLHDVVDEAWRAIQQVQQRLTTDVRPEDDIVNVTLGGHAGTSPGEVTVVLRAHVNHSDAQIGDAVKAHLERAGLQNATLRFVRPAIDPIRPPVVTPPNPNSAKAKVEAFAADIKKVQSRMTEELRIEDAVASVKLQGAKVVITVSHSAFDKEAVRAWAKDELAQRGIALPLVVKE